MSVKFSKFFGLVFLELFNRTYCSLSRVLNSRQALEVNIAIMRAFFASQAKLVKAD